MALIEDSKGRQDEDSGYGRVFGSSQLGKLISRVHVCAIRNGNELEKLLWAATPYKSTLATILRAHTNDPNNQAIHVISASVIKREMPGAPLTDLLILTLVKGELLVVELKDGDTFDTKKADGELASAQKFAQWIRPQVVYPVRYYFCAFNRSDKASIVAGIKGRFRIEEVMTGAELCSLIGVDYNAIRALRQHDEAQNRAYFVQQLLSIPEMRSLIEHHFEEQ